MFNFPYFGYPYHNPYYRYYNAPKNYVNIQKKKVMITLLSKFQKKNQQQKMSKEFYPLWTTILKKTLQFLKYLV